MWILFALAYPYSDAFSYPTNPERFRVKCFLRKYLKEYKGIIHINNDEYNYYLQKMWSEYNTSQIDEIAAKYKDYC